MEIEERKAQLRAKMRAIRKSIDERNRFKAAQALIPQLIGLPAIRRAHTIGVYSPFGSEVDLNPAIKELRKLDSMPTIAYPLVINDTAMLFVKFSLNDDRRVLENPKVHVTNIRQERVVNSEDLDVVLVPGVAFDEHGHRLGQGGGYYDRYLPHLRGDAMSLGIAFDEQVIDEVPCGVHDRGVDYVLTPTRLITAH